jgi:hypothetical protein
VATGAPVAGFPVIVTVDFIQLIDVSPLDKNPGDRSMPSHPEPPDESPRGTVMIIAVFGGLLVLGWLLMFFGLFVPRGTH